MSCTLRVSKVLVTTDRDAGSQPETLDPKTRNEWIDMAARVVARPRELSSSETNEALQAAASREPQSPVAPAYRLWIAENLAQEGRYADAIRAYDDAIDAAQSSRRLAADLDPALGALYHKAQAAALSGDTATAVATYVELGSDIRRGPDALFQAGLLTEAAGDRTVAAEFYGSAAKAPPSSRTDDSSELARRSLLRLDDPAMTYAADPSALGEAIADAIKRRAFTDFERLISKTHFAVGPMGGHTAFESLDLVEEFLRDFRDSPVVARRGLLGSGQKMYLQTSGWRGKWFEGDVAFILHKAPPGWLWTGLGLSVAGDLWRERWRPPVLASNQALPFELLAPWPADLSFAAGGITQYAIQQAGVLAAGPFGFIAAAVLARSRCGFGPRGFYYNQWPTHEGQDAFAIDFTRYRRYVPYLEESEGTPVLATRSGIVSWVQAGELSGSWSQSNTVEIWHADPDPPGDIDRFTSKYLHLEGPFKIPWFRMMPILAGNRVGTMDDTGNSVLDHLHFSIHDKQKNGASVRPTPLSGVRLEDGDSGRCVLSTNIEYVGARPVKEVSTLVSQHWLITPAALAMNETAPTRIQDQKWVLVVDGVAIVDLKGVSNAQWLKETFSINPSLSEPLNYAATKYGIPRPPGTDGANFWTGFQVEQWVPFAGLGSIFNRGQSVDSGFAVDEWRLNPLTSGTDVFTNTPLTNLFAGMQVDVAVRDTDAWLHRVGYHITLLGKIVFGPIVIT